MSSVCSDRSGEWSTVRNRSSGRVRSIAQPALGQDSAQVWPVNRLGTLDLMPMGIAQAAEILNPASNCRVQKHAQQPCSSV